MNGILTYVDDWIDMAIMQNVTDTNKALVASDVVSDLQNRSLIIFDFDGTMADTLPTIVSTAKMAMTDCGHTDFIESDLKKLVGHRFLMRLSWSLDSAMRTLLRLLSVTESFM